ncbi:hypothetical protein VZT92_005518 [Zoarces viviparus]|uniref:Uncharacterized protein n=1 Tax=Zoarces viviparus TaxID=48416 RepID=A0AAW1FUR0_ZOAVI
MAAAQKKPKALSPELAPDIDKAVMVVLTLNSASMVAVSRIMAQQTMMQCNSWIRRDMLEGPISPGELFGPLHEKVTARVKTDVLQQSCTSAAAPDNETLS